MPICCNYFISVIVKYSLKYKFKMSKKENNGDSSRYNWKRSVIECFWDKSYARTHTPYLSIAPHRSHLFFRLISACIVWTWWVFDPCIRHRYPCSVVGLTRQPKLVRPLCSITVCVKATDIWNNYYLRSFNYSNTALPE